MLQRCIHYVKRLNSIIATSTVSYICFCFFCWYRLYMYDQFRKGTPIESAYLVYIYIYRLPDTQAVWAFRMLRVPVCIMYLSYDQQHISYTHNHKKIKTKIRM